MTKSEVLAKVKAGTLPWQEASVILEAIAKQRLTNIIDVIEFCRREHLPADVVGRWVWLSFAEKPSEEIREKIKAVGFRWVQSRGEWAHDCGHPSHHTKGWPPRVKYGAVSVREMEAVA